jgi:TolB-like protein/lipoprotein NlpI
LIQNKEHEPISEIAPEYNMVLHKLLSKETENRFQSFEELTEAITSHRLQSTGIINKKQRYLVYLISIIAIIVLGYLLYNYVGTDLGKDSTKQWENSIGVLPFDDLSSEKDQEWFCDGMTEQIISNLSRLPKLKVIARQSMMKYKDTDKSISEIGEELNVAYVLESSIRKYGNRIRVTAQLISTIDEYHVWSEDYDKEYREFFDVQDDVSAAIASNLLTTLSSNDEKKIKTNRTISTEAYEYYMKGMYFHHNKLLSSWDKIDFISSEKMLKNAIYLDPNYADAYASLADLYNTYYDIFVEDSVDEDKVDKNKYVQLQETYRDTATILNPNSPELHYVNGSIYQIKNMYDEAFSSFKIAIKLNPNNARYYSSLGLLLYKKGCLKLSIKCIGRAIELNPLIQHNYFDRGYNFYLLGELESAERDFLKSLDLYSNHKFTFLFYSLLLLSTKRFGEADSLNLYMEDILSAKEMNILRAINYAYKGQREKALNAIKSLREAHCTEVYALLGMNHKAITSLKKWLEIRKKYIHNEYFYLTNYRFFDNIRSDPRFQEILAKHKELYEENLEKYGDIDI